LSLATRTQCGERHGDPSTTLARLRIATNAVWRDADGNRQETAEFHNVVAFGKPNVRLLHTGCIRL
jgi:single-stranded DNA-binding protein